MTGEISPAPWHWKTGVYFSTLVDAKGDEVLWYTTADDGVHCKRSDKPVIAAAPELLDELQTARNVIATACGETAPYARIALSRIDATIAKARGQQ